MISNEKLKAAYALNLWTVSISQIIDYNDMNILEQEYNTIMNNLNLENMPKDEALLDVIKKIYKNAHNGKAKKGRWDYYKLGMRFVSKGEKTILLARSLKDEEIDDLLQLAIQLKDKQGIKIPEGINSVKYEALEKMYGGLFKRKKDIGLDILKATIMTPVAAVVQVGELAMNTVQWGKNLFSSKDLEFIQYAVAIYEYLNCEGAIID